jgi:phage shock protein C
MNEEDEILNEAPDDTVENSGEISKGLKRANDRYLGGVCGGIAEYFGINPLVIRILWSIITAITFMLPGLLIYIVFWVFMESPDE